jgi:hypothetical protein
MLQTSKKVVNLALIGLINDVHPVARTVGLVKTSSHPIIRHRPENTDAVSP